MEIYLLWSMKVFNTQNIDHYLWSFDINGNLVTANTKDATFTFPNYGTYEGTMIVSSDSVSCEDTAFITVNILPSPIVDFDFTYDSCAISAVTFTNLSMPTFGDSIVSWEWYFGNNVFSHDQNPIYQYPIAGNYDVILQVTGNNGCVDSLVKNITWAPTSIIDILPNTNWGCTPETIVFSNHSYPINGYTTNWTLGDGQTSIDVSPSHTYNQPGVYDIIIEIKSPLGCISTDTFPHLITIYDSPQPHFTVDYDSCKNEPIQLHDHSIAGISPITQWKWLLGNGDSLVQYNDSTIHYFYKSIRYL